MAVCGSLCSVMSAPSRRDEDLDAAVLLVAERLVHLRSLVELDPVGDDEGGVDLPLLDALEQVVGPAVDVGLPVRNVRPLFIMAPKGTLSTRPP